MTVPLKLHIETYGEGPVELVLCNGLSQTTANWRALARSTPGYRWILYDVRGQGRSPLGPRPYHIDDHVTDLRDVLAQTSAVTPILMGFSHGARVSLRAAAEYPNLFAGLVLVSCGSRITDRRRAHVTSWSKCLELGGVRAMAWASLPSIVGARLLAKFKDLDLLVKATVSRNTEEGLRAMLEGMASYPPIQADAERVPLPTLILNGEEDPLVGHQDGEDFADWIPRSRAITFPECGHTLPLEEPKGFLDAIQNFIATREGN